MNKEVLNNENYIKSKLEECEKEFERVGIELQKVKQLENYYFQLQVRIATYKDILNPPKLENKETDNKKE